jgi:hypothetical protein
MARRIEGATDWPEDGVDRLDLETAFAHGDPMPMGWSLGDVRRAWDDLGADFIAAGGDDCWAYDEWGSPAGRTI